MASGLYDNGRQLFLQGDLDWANDTIKVALVDTGTYTADLATHDFYDDLSGVVGTDVTLTSKTTTAGVADAADATFSSVSGATVEALVIYKSTGVSSTSPLIAYIDGISVTPNGGDITVVWDSGANKIFKL